jgi:F-type H+-transporting ATPase subunit b
VNIDWTSFSLEIINFLVLVWLLKHFLYKPVMDIIGRRQALIAEDLAKAEQARQAAAQMVTDFEARSKEMDSERLRAREELGQEIATLRIAKLEALEAEIAAERDKGAVLRQHEKSEMLRACEEQAVTLAARFASRLLERFASPALCDQLVALAIEQLATLPETTRVQLEASIEQQHAPVRVCSSHPLGDAIRQRLEAALGALTGTPPPVEYSVDPALIAGVAIRVEALLLDASLAAELKLFEASGDAV